MGPRKKTMTEYSSCPNNNPIWNSEIILKLTRCQCEPIVFVVVDFSNNQVGQVVIPLVEIKHGGPSSDLNGSASQLKCSEMEPSQKCAQPTGHLFYRIYVDEYYPLENMESHFNGGKRLSIFSRKSDPKSSYIPGGSQLNISHSEKTKAPKRLSFFKSNDKSDNFKYKIGKAKSLANIHTIETIEQSQSSDSDIDRKECFPPDNIYDDVTADFGWVRVGDINGDKTMLRCESVNGNGYDVDRVDVWSVQPDNGPITGNFTVVIEGSNFTSGLFELTYVSIDGLEPIDADTCTEIVSNTELILTMPPISHPGMVNINLELLDGSMISCSKTFHYTDPNIEDSQCHIFTPRNVDTEYPDLSSLDDVLEQYEDILSSPIHDYKPKTTNNKLVLKRDSGMGSFNEVVNGQCNNHRKRSDYGSQGSLSSERTSSVRRKARQITMSKMELFEEVGLLRREVADLQVQLQDLASSTNTQIAAFKCQLEARDTEIDNISQSLGNLRVKLLEDGLTDYLELK